MKPARLEHVALLGIVALLLGVHALALRWTGALWGAHFYAFLPAAAGWAAAALVIAAVLPLLRPRPAANEPAPPAEAPATVEPPAPGLPGVAQAAFTLLVMVGTAACFWIFRIRHILLGDGIPLTARLPAGERFHELEPLTSVIQHGLYRIVHSMGSGGRPEYEVAWTAVAAGSALAGALFVPVAWALAGELEGGPAGAPRTWRPRSARLLLFLIVLAQGYMQLFFGYVENYTWYTLAAGLYLLLALRWLRGRGSLVPAGAALLLALGLHLSGGVLLPSFLVLALAGFARGGRRRATVRDLGWLALVCVALSVALTRLAPGYGLASTLLDVTKRALVSGEAAPGIDLLSRLHLREFINEQLLIGPLALPLFLLALAGARPRGGAPVLFAVTAGLSYLGVSWLARDSNLGYARNWDLLAPGALVTLSAALLLWREHRGARAADGRALTLALIVSLAHTVPWIAVNADEARALKRFEQLPLGLGRTESTLGHWYAVRGRPAEAERWWVRSLDVYPANVRAHVFLGELYLGEGRADLAVEAFAAAVRLRPDKAEYRLDLVSALAQSGRPGDARTEVERLLRARPEDPALWGLDGVLLALDGDLADARVAIGLAAAHDAAPVYARALARLDQADGRAGLRGDWLEMLALAKASLP